MHFDCPTYEESRPPTPNPSRMSCDAMKRGPFSSNVVHAIVEPPFSLDWPVSRPSSSLHVACTGTQEDRFEATPPQSPLLAECGQQICRRALKKMVCRALLLERESQYRRSYSKSLAPYKPLRLQSAHSQGLACPSRQWQFCHLVSSQVWHPSTSYS
jgi:hypothetical protein